MAVPMDLATHIKHIPTGTGDTTDHTKKITTSSPMEEIPTVEEAATDKNILTRATKIPTQRIMQRHLAVVTTEEATMEQTTMEQTTTVLTTTVLMTTVLTTMEQTTTEQMIMEQTSITAVESTRARPRSLF